ncbi:TIR domain-containing protein [Butyrivibrio sp. VCB2006]|uniref:TIR domain-containing protein n=1 Tax=Butyrivibrio sp. VCB2006 TaxID=1280679 RepID=UPI0003F7F68C|nr:TIR domain-containing protein [Butyrivibrio sp. VCB2006]
MGLHYNAFISYKHAELDNKVAAAIEWDLEHYHIPGKIQKKTGFKKIERIFRDKDELPITSDLSNTIEEALYNSDYLIVLCSTNTHLSTWVEREIKLFLQNHPQENVLTVLVDGEPHDVIPQILQNREEQKYNEKGELETVLTPVEPLSCDYRLPRREAKSVELPRLAATLIGCSYNELMNRQRQYKMKRLTAIFSGAMALAVGFGAYMLYSNARINENYRQSLISQSKYLANASSQYLSDDKRIDALQLALAALPSEDNPDRPVVPEAVSAISNATMAYKVETGGNITATWNYTMPDTVHNYEIDKDGCSFTALDRSKNLKVWNRETHELLYEYSSVDKEVKYYGYIAPDVLLICSSEYMQAVDVLNGTIKWERESLAEGDELFYNITEKPVVMKDGSVLIGTYCNGLYKLDPEDGSTIRKYVSTPADPYYESASFSGFVLSPDEKTIIFKGKNDSNNNSILFFYDMETGTTAYDDLVELGMMDEDDFLDKVVYLDDGNIIIAIDTSEGYGSYGYYSMDVLTKCHEVLYCIDAHNYTVKWASEMDYNSISYGTRLYDLPKSNAVWFCTGNMICIWDKDTGELLHEYNVGESIVGVAYVEGDEDPSFVTVSGKMGAVSSIDDDTIAMTSTFVRDIEDIAFGHGAFVKTEYSNSIIFYEAKVRDDAYKEFTNSSEFKVILSDDYLIDGDLMAVIGRSPDGTVVKIAFFDAASKECLGEKELGDAEDYYMYNLAGFEDGVARITYKKDQVLRLFEVDARTLELKAQIIDKDNSVTSLDPFYCGGKLYYQFNENYSRMGFKVRDLATGRDTTYDTDRVDMWEYNQQLDVMYVALRDKDQLIDLKTKKTTDIVHSANWGETSCVEIDANNNRLIVTDDQSIQVMDLEGNELTKIICPELDVYGMNIYTPQGKNAVKELMVVYGDGYLYRYNLETGEYISKLELTYNSGYKTAEFKYNEGRNQLFVQMGPILNIVDLDNWTMITYLLTALGYHENSDSFLVYTHTVDSTSKVGYFKQYTVDELIQKGKDMLKGQEISEELKVTYGLQ